jgi:large subunit ribosomal protein L15
MARKDRKARKKLGIRTRGKGRKGSRKRGGGKGMAGSKKHKYSWILKNKPGWFGSESMKGKAKPKTVNIGYLAEYAEKKGLKEIDADSLGFKKVLGGGKVGKALTVKASKFTEKAKTKIEKAGGKTVEK